MLAKVSENFTACKFTFCSCIGGVVPTTEVGDHGISMSSLFKYGNEH